MAHKVKVKVDHNEYKYDYENDLNPKGDDATMTYILQSIRLEGDKIKLN